MVAFSCSNSYTHPPFYCTPPLPQWKSESRTNARKKFNQQVSRSQFNEDSGNIQEYKESPTHLRSQDPTAANLRQTDVSATKSSKSKTSLPSPQPVPVDAAVAEDIIRTSQSSGGQHGTEGGRSDNDFWACLGCGL